MLNWRQKSAVRSSRSIYAHNASLRYTFGMQKSTPSVKTAISLQRQLFLQVDRIAREQKLPRSRVFVLALEAYVAHYQNQLLLEQAVLALKQRGVEALWPQQLPCNDAALPVGQLLRQIGGGGAGEQETPPKP